jgi:hypothetical protein
MKAENILVLKVTLDSVEDRGVIAVQSCEFGAAGCHG